MCVKYDSLAIVDVIINLDITFRKLALAPMYIY